MKRKRTIPPMSPRWEDRLWPILNRLRGDLIHKDVYQLPMTATEKDNLETLQAYADYYVSRRHLGPKIPKRLLKMLESLKTSESGE